jgi:NAD(P)-dependent dehydrogenase (short-subunit alcohol dehydrogenase family)
MQHTKTALVTGATSGIGEVTARELARAGYHVLITARDPAKGERVLRDLHAGGGAAELFVGDLSRMNDVRRVASEVRARHARLDLLVNNAGGVFSSREVTPDGFERTFALNHLAYVLLTRLLLDRLTVTGDARVVSVASNANRAGRLNWADLQYERGYLGFNAYAQSKLMNVVFALALARRLNGTGVTSNALHPGVVKSGFWDHGNWMTAPVFRIIKTFTGVTPAQGARTTLLLATSDEVRGVTGQYFEDGRVQRAHPVAYDESAQEKLWRTSEQLLTPWLDPDA